MSSSTVQDTLKEIESLLAVAEHRYGNSSDSSDGLTSVDWVAWTSGLVCSHNGNERRIVRPLHDCPMLEKDMQRTRLALNLVEILFVIAIVGLCFALFVPVPRHAPEAASRNSCRNNLKQIALALYNYEAENGALPPAYTVDAEGNRLHSWRTLILPYFENAPLYDSIDLSKPWDDPVNAKARESAVPEYCCPSASLDEGLTTYLAVVGPNCAFSGSVPRELSEVTDGLENTMAVIEADSDQAVHWMSPNDDSEEVVLEYGSDTHTNHPGIIIAAFLDGHVLAVPLDSDPDGLRAMLTIAGGEAIVDD